MSIELIYISILVYLMFTIFFENRLKAVVTLCMNLVRFMFQISFFIYELNI